MSKYGPNYELAVRQLELEIGNEAAGLIAIGQLPENAVKIATIRVTRRREIAAQQRAGGNVVLLQDHRSRPREA